MDVHHSATSMSRNRSAFCDSRCQLSSISVNGRLITDDWTRSAVRPSIYLSKLVTTGRSAMSRLTRAYWSFRSKVLGYLNECFDERRACRFRAFSITIYEWHTHIDRECTLSNTVSYYVIVSRDSWIERRNAERNKEQAWAWSGKKEGKCETLELMFSAISSWHCFF